jgi:hypothetical protein
MQNISDLIANLEDIKKEYGDIPVKDFSFVRWGETMEFGGFTVEIANRNAFCEVSHRPYKSDYAIAKEIFDSDIPWSAKFHQIFALDHPHFDWYDPDTTYEDDVTAFFNAWTEHRNKQEQE